MPSSRFPVLASLLVALLVSGGCERRPSPAPANDPARLASLLDSDFGQLRAKTESLAAFIAGLYARRDEILPSIDRSRYAFAPNGAFYKPVDNGGAALWISAAMPVTPRMQEVAYFTEPADAELMRICRESPAVSQAYYNDRHSLNRIYPWIDTIAQYPPRMNIPSFNFYYLADGDHNPQRKGVWVSEPYVDPAGRGWMVSSVAPVYVNSVLEGVPGLDITIATIVNRYLQDYDRPIAIISHEGMLVVATDAAIQILQMPPLKDHKYLETVKLDLFKPEEYNIRKSTLRPVRAMATALLDKGRRSHNLRLPDQHYTVLAAPVTELGWIVVEFSAP